MSETAKPSARQLLEKLEQRHSTMLTVQNEARLLLEQLRHRILEGDSTGDRIIDAITYCVGIPAENPHLVTNLKTLAEIIRSNSGKLFAVRRDHFSQGDQQTIESTTLKVGWINQGSDGIHIHHPSSIQIVGNETHIPLTAEVLNALNRHPIAHLDMNSFGPIRIEHDGTAYQITFLLSDALVAQTFMATRAYWTKQDPRFEVHNWEQFKRLVHFAELEHRIYHTDEDNPIRILIKETQREYLELVLELYEQRETNILARERCWSLLMIAEEIGMTKNLKISILREEFGIV